MAKVKKAVEKEVSLSHKTAGFEFEKNPSQPMETVDAEDGSIDVELGYTKNLGNFESVRITVRVSRPTKMANIDATFQETRNWIESKIKEELDSVKPEKASPKKSTSALDSLTPVSRSPIIDPFDE